MNVGGGHAYAHLIDQSRPWWKNRRLLALNGWLALLSAEIAL